MHPWLNWIEYLTTNQEVAGSSPAGCILREIAQLGRALGLGPRGRRFESCFPDSNLWGISSAGRAPALHAGGQRFDPAILHHLLFKMRVLDRNSSIKIKKMIES